MPRWVCSKSLLIALSNLLDDLLCVPALPEAARQNCDAAGPEYRPCEDLLRQFAAVVGKRPWILPVPVLSPGVSAQWPGLVTAVPANLARALIQGLKHSIPGDDSVLRRPAPQQLLTFKAAEVAALDTERSHCVLACWTGGAFHIRRFSPGCAFYVKRASSGAETTSIAGRGLAGRRGSGRPVGLPLHGLALDSARWPTG